MKEELEKLVAAGKIGRQHVEPLLRLIEGGYCSHRSWGFGRITTVDTVFSRLLVDFGSKTGHSMDLAFAAQSLKPIPADHILARKAADLAGLQKMAAMDHLDLIRIVLRSYGGQATVDQIQQVLVPDVITEDWKKWWEVARREMKKDGQFQVPARKSEPVVYEEQTVPLRDRLLGEFQAAKGLKAHVAVAVETLKSLEDVEDPGPLLEEIFRVLDAEIQSHRETQTALAQEAVFVRDDLRKATGITATSEEPSAADLWRQERLPAEIFEEIPAAKHRHALASFRDTFPEDWPDRLLGIMNSVSARLCGESAALLVQEGQLDPLREMLSRLVNQHSASSELLLWLGKERSDSFADILGPEVFRCMLTAMERDQFNEKRSNRLRDFILDDHELMADLIESADIEVVKDLVRALQFSPTFDDMDKRSLLGRIVKIFPSIQALISGETVRQDSALLVSWASLERRKEEYAELVQKKIPANSRDIAVARSYGDLRENHEYKAAKEMHRLLMKRKHELEQQLSRARGIDYADASASAVNIGTRVSVTELNTGHAETFAVLGAWDFDAEQGLISYLSPMGQAVLNHKVGEEVDFEIDGSKKRFRIDRIERYLERQTSSEGLTGETPAPESQSSDGSTDPGPANQAPASGGAEPAEPAPEKAPPPQEVSGSAG